MELPAVMRYVEPQLSPLRATGAEEDDDAVAAGVVEPGCVYAFIVCDATRDSCPEGESVGLGYLTLTCGV